MKTAALLLAAAALAATDISPKSGTFNPKRLQQERSFAAPGLWLFAPGGKYVATATGIDGFGLIDVVTGKDLGSIGNHPGGRHDGNFGQNDHILATTSNDGEVRVWDATTRKEIASFVGDKQPHPGYT